MNRLLLLSAVGLIFFQSCKLAEPVGYNAYANGHQRTTFIQDVEVVVGDRKNLNSNSEIAPSYTRKQLMEEQQVPTYSIFNISENFRKMTARSESLYTFIEDWLGTPYRLGGTTRRGIDCSAFMQEVFAAVYKYRIPRTSRDQYAIAKKINSKEELREGDLVFFKIRSKQISHVGIYLADGKFAHASSSRGVVISSLDEEYWRRYYVGGGRVEEAIYALN